MLRLAADENFNNDIVRGLWRRKPDLDIVRVQDIGLSGADDPTVLEWAAQEGRILLTHDVSTITKFFGPEAPAFRCGEEGHLSCTLSPEPKGLGRTVQGRLLLAEIESSLLH